MWVVDGRHWRIALVLPPPIRSCRCRCPNRWIDRFWFPTRPAAVYAAIPDCNLYNREASASPSGFLMTTAKGSTNNFGFRPFGTRSVQLSERKRDTLLPKRHQIKHLEFVVS
jgi:hypothetical protein